MALLHWRKFVFFEEEYIRGTELSQLINPDEQQGAQQQQQAAAVIAAGSTVTSNDKNPQSSFVTIKIKCSSSGRGCILLGDENGYVYIVDRYLKINSFRANQKFTSHIKQIVKSSIFITCGSDVEAVNPVIKIWDPDKTDRLNQPTCVRLIRANSGFIEPSPITCLECNEQLTFMAVGYGDGSIILHQGDITRSRRSKFGRPIKVSERPITGIVIESKQATNKLNSSSSGGYLSASSSSNQLTDTNAFITTDREIFYATLSDKSFMKVRLDEMGCDPKCCCLLADSGQDSKSSSDSLFAVGRNNAVYFYGIDGRGPCLAFEGEKLILTRFKNYLAVISRELPGKSEQPTNSGARLRNRNRAMAQEKGDGLGAGGGLYEVGKRVSLNIYDIKNKYIAHSSSIPEVLEIFSEWGQLFVICSSGQVIVFREKDVQTKLEILFRKNQFGLVISIAQKHQYSEDALKDIFKHYGDHLYRKGDYEGAIMQYIKTIGQSEPSYVIKKFLDSKRIGSLTVYLEALHQKSQASQDHTKLLLHCYSKLKNDQQLKHFIESYEEGNIKFDVEIAINVLREAGFHEFAIDLARKHGCHRSYFKIQLEDSNNSEAALEYMLGMRDPHEMAKYMKKYGRIMLREAAEKTIFMIDTICQRSRDSMLLSSSWPGSVQQQATSSDLLNVESVLASSTIPHSTTTKPPLIDSTTSPAATNTTKKQIYPEEFFHIFVDNNDLFVQLLEQLVEGGTDFATRAVHNLLLELYLKAWRRQRDELLKASQADKIKRLLTQPSQKFDLDHALILCRSNRFDEGLLELYARANLYHLILQYYIDQDDSLKIIKTCDQYGRHSPALYMPALIHYSRTGDERLTNILKAIEHQKLISPMVVIKILLESKRATLGPVKEYLVRFLDKLHEMHLDNENAIDQYKDDTEMVRQKIDQFENHQTVFKPSTCSACQGPLDLPSVHFLCSHSYHQNCFYMHSAESDECPICVSTNRKLLDEIGSHETSKSTLIKLERQFSAPSVDTFHGIAELFGYGLLASSANNQPTN